ncbi:phosphatase PAP2 family protein [Vreelandella titanicae]|uniref:phosphatase PAP2 family protein n=1 Tax=Halomonadaceae TaxID=28256 RepID=UPI0004887BD0|nr:MULTISPECIES: phosphatase PAP2 family protein [unclassified Halomonas]
MTSGRRRGRPQRPPTPLGYLLLARHYRAALFASIAVPGGILLSTVMKLGFDSPRPDLVPHEAMLYTASFPSSHSMMSAVTYLTLAALQNQRFSGVL